MRRLLLAVPLLLIPSTAHASAAWNPSYSPAFVARAHASLTFPLLTQVCAGPGCVLGGGVTAGTYAGDFVWSGKHTWGSAADAANSVRLGETAGAIVFEGTGADAGEVTLTAADPSTNDYTITIPASASTTLAGLAVAGTWTAAQTFNDDVRLIFGTGADAALEYNTTFTVDNLAIEVGQDGRSIVVIEQADRAFDFAHAQQTNPTLYVHSANQSTTEWISLAHNQTNGVIDVGTGSINFNDAVTLTVTSLMNDNVRLNLGTQMGFITGNTSQAPDSGAIFTGVLSNSIELAETGDVGNNLGNGPGGSNALTQPGLIVHSQNNVTTEYTTVQAGALTTRRNRTLTEAGGAEELFRITTATLQSGGGEIDYKIHATDGTDFAVRQGKIRFVFYNNAGTVTATISGADETADGSVAIVSAGETLTYALTVNVATANVFIFLINIDSNITVNAAHADYIVTYNGPGEVVFP